MALLQDPEAFQSLIAPDEDISLDKLEEWLQNLDEKAPEDARLKDVSYQKSYNESLGLLPNDPMDFTVFMPWEAWDQENQRNFTAPLQKALVDVISHGFSDTRSPFVDLASLMPHLHFLAESGKDKDGKHVPSVVEALADFVNCCDHSSTAPVIRFLIGDDAAKSRGETWGQKSLFTDLFWRDGAPLVKHPKARIYVGYYNPNFRPK